MHNKALWLASLLLMTLLRAPAEDLGKRVQVQSLAKNVWLIRSVSKIPGFGDVESNALVVAGDREAVLIDTPVTVEQTAVVLDWAEAGLKQPVRHLIATHWHADRMGGIDATTLRGIETWALGKTIELAKQHRLTLPRHEVRSGQQLRLAGVALEIFYPGHGHTSDNIVVWLPRDKVLHGACFVKAVEAKNLGNLQEIDIPRWRKGMAVVRERYASALIVIPGHGPVGGTELLAHTNRLLEAAAGKE
jgi:metallo-beta-lactamase class B